MQAVAPSSNVSTEDFTYQAEPLTSAEELQSALRLSPEKLQAYLARLMGQRRGKHSIARAKAGAAQVAKRKAKRKA